MTQPLAAFRRCALPLLLFVVAGCTTATPEPVDSYSSLAEQSYPFDAVWECSAEAIENTGYTIVESRRDGEDEGTIVTEFKIVKEDAFSEHAEALRIKLRVTKKGEKSFAVEVAPSRFQREYTRDDWSYLKKDEDLLRQVDAALGDALIKRYRGG
ncbi:MAG: hypothetical protein JKY65_18650 [Planctomycetes bacterium]|nr:hypothetical protein [Planctomycetota bacterium]